MMEQRFAKFVRQPCDFLHGKLLGSLNRVLHILDAQTESWSRKRIPLSVRVLQMLLVKI